MRNNDISAIVESLRDLLLRNKDPASDAGKLARETGGLPVYGDAGGWLILLPTGDVVQWDSDSMTVSAVEQAGWKKLALVAASDRFPELQSLRPTPPENATSCDACLGTGRRALKVTYCGKCFGTGWFSS